VRFRGSEILPDQSCRRVREPPGRQDHEHEDFDRDGITCNRHAAEGRAKTDEAGPARGRDQELQDAGERYPEQTPQDRQVQANLLEMDSDAAVSVEENPELEAYAEAAAGGGRDGSAHDVELRERSPAVDQARVEDDVDQVREPECAHGERGI